MKIYAVRLYNIFTTHHFDTLKEAEAFSKRCGFQNIIEEMQEPRSRVLSPSIMDNEAWN